MFATYYLKRLTLLLFIFSSPIFAADDYVVIVNKTVEIDSLSLTQVRNIFLSNTDALPNGSAVVPLDQSNGTEVRRDFYKQVVQMSERQVKSYFTSLVFTGKGRPPKR